MPEENPVPQPSDTSNHQVQTVYLESGNPFPTGDFTTGIEPEN